MKSTSGGLLGELTVEIVVKYTEQESSVQLKRNFMQ